MNEIEVKTHLTQKQEAFVQAFVNGETYCNALQSYKIAYPDASDSTCINGSKLLMQNPKITRRINELLDDAGLSDQFVDKQLLMMITQNVDFKAKMIAIKEYNRLRRRVIELHDHTSNGESIGSQVLNVIVTGNFKG